MPVLLLRFRVDPAAKTRSAVIASSNMKRTFPHPALIVPLLFLIPSCSEPSLPGKWKLRRMDIMDLPNQRRQLTLDLNDPDQMKAALYKADQSRDVRSSGTDRGAMDTVDSAAAGKRKAGIDSFVNSALHTAMTLERNKRFFMRSNGLIVCSVPGWHFGDSLEGSWMRKDDTLVLVTGEGEQGYTWKFVIRQLTNKALELQGVFDGFEGRGNAFWFVRQ